MISPFPKSSSAAGDGTIVVKLLPNGVPSLETVTYQYPLKLISPPRNHELKSILIFLLSYGGGLVGGDSVNLSIDVRPGSRLSIVTQGHTKIFKSATPDIVTRQNLNVAISNEGALCLLPDPVQPFEDSVYEQKQIFKLTGNASLCLLDWVTQGRTARGENWSLVRWIGRNEIWWSSVNKDAKSRLLTRDALILDGKQSLSQTMNGLKDTMHGLGIFGTLILRGPLMKSVGDFFLAEFDAMSRIGAKDWRSNAEREAEVEEKDPHEIWRYRRHKMEQDQRVLWSEATVRGCVIVKFGAATVEAGRVWIGSMLVKEGSIAEHFGDQALLCVR